MPEVSFCRRVHFRAQHHYSLGGDAAADRAAFGDSAEPHAHHWVVTLHLTGPLDANGMVVDLVHLDAVLDEVIVQPFADSHINKVDPFFETHQPTNEVLCGYFADKLKDRFPGVRLTLVRVAEDPDLYAEWTP